MRQKIDEVVEGAFKVNVVFPEGIVCIDDEVLSCHLVGRGARWKGISKTASTSTGAPLRNAGVNSHLASASCAVRSSRSSRWRSSEIMSTCPSLRMTAASRTTPSTRSAAAAATYLGSTFRRGQGARMSTGGDPGSGSRSANQTSQLPEKLVTFGIWIATV